MSQPTLTLLVRDPYCLFAFWDGAPRAAVLKIDEVDASGRVQRPSAARAVLDKREESRYISVPSAGRSYVGRLLDEAGRCLAQSEVVRTPPAPARPGEEAGAALGALMSGTLAGTYVSSPGLFTARAWGDGRGPQA